jgi:hypothetical protein
MSYFPTDSTLRSDMHHNEERIEHDSEMMVVTPGDASRLLVRMMCNQRDGNF